MKTSAPTRQRKAYSKPSVTIYGDVAEITRGNSTGFFLDANFPAGTFYGDLTFS